MPFPDPGIEPTSLTCPALDSFAELAELHVTYLNMLKKGETEKLMNLRSKVIDLWCNNKKDVGKGLVKLISEGKNEGISIRKSKLTENEDIYSEFPFRFNSNIIWAIIC